MHILKGLVYPEKQLLNNKCYFLEINRKISKLYIPQGYF